MVLVILPTALAARGTPDVVPVVTLASESGVFISPNDDGIQDELRLAPILSESGTRAIKSFQLTVFGATGDLAGLVVWTRRETQEENRGFFGDLLNVGEEPRINIPESLTWDGRFLGSQVGTDGADVPDGSYIYQLTITDERGAGSSTPPMNVEVDREPPVIVDVRVADPVFSPNADGVRDTVEILQSGSREVLWTGVITGESGVTVRSFEWRSASSDFVSADVAPPGATWDGTDGNGTIVPDGLYEYVLTGSDRSGNSSASRPVAVRVSTRAGDVRLLPDVTSFSPNGDGSLDTVTVGTFVTETDGLVDYAISLRSVSAPDGTVWSLGGSAPVPSEFELGGFDTRGRALPDGPYEMTLDVNYDNGNRASSEPVTLTIDTAAPTGTITAQTGPVETERDAPFAFGGTNKRHVDVRVALSEESEWIAVANFGDRVYRVPLSELGMDETEFAFRWDGTDLDGKPVPDGLVSLRFETVDPAGNTGRTNQVQALLDTRTAEVGVNFDRATFSPDDDGVLDTVVVRTEYSVEDLIDEFLLAVEDDSGRILRTEYKRAPFSSFEWLGRTNGNTVVPDGEYRATLRVIYHNGNEPVARSAPVVVDKTNPQVVHLSTAYRLFSPDADGERDQVAIQQETSVEDEWVGEIEGPDGRVVFRRVWTGRATSFAWDGRDQSGRVVPDGDYTYRISADDIAGNTGSEDLTLVVDTRSAPISQQPPDVSLSVGPLPFTPDGDGANDTLTITSAAASENTLSRWELVVADPFGVEFRRWNGTGAPRSVVTWDGKSASGELVQSAQEYTVTLSVTDDRGNVGSSQASALVGILVIRDGLTLRIMVPSIHFAPYTSDLFSVSTEELAKNLDTLRSLATVLNRYSDRQILIEGHAAHDYYQEGLRKEREQREELLPLSAARAEEVRQALIILGVDSGRMRTIGIGGARPVVPHSDRGNLWKNRRVEFILERR
jgi:outer membrane protein OmpA-like peptidoglycan-associated protein/flagellar hook assembly protein FlgD